MNSIISWVGGKKALRDLIYLRMPPQYDRYIEVFGGGGWVLFGKPPDKCMEVYNDFNSNLANLFYCVRERPMALIKELSFLPLNSRDEFVALRKFLTMEEFKSEHLSEELEIATHFLKEPEAAEIRDILMERAAVGDVKRAAAWGRSNSGTGASKDSRMRCVDGNTKAGHRQCGYEVCHQGKRVPVLSGHLQCTEERKRKRTSGGCFRRWRNAFNRGVNPMHGENRQGTWPGNKCR